MIFRFNRFAIFPVMCNCCKRYIWLDLYITLWYDFYKKYFLNYWRNKKYEEKNINYSFM